MTVQLELRALKKRFGGLTAVNDVSFAVQTGEIFGIIGPNGAGKTTLFNLIAGVHRPSGGSILYRGQDITGFSCDAVARLGIARTFQATHVFKTESVYENLRRAALLARAYNPLALFRHARHTESPAQDERILEISRFIGFDSLLHAVAGTLAYGQQKVLGVGMALMTTPHLVLMDEPAAGLNPSEKRMIGELICRMRDDLGLDIVLVEHDMRLIMDICNRILVVNQGTPIAIGTPDVIKNDQHVIDAYLGVDYEFA